MKDTRAMYVSNETRKRFKEYCMENGIKMGFALDKIINDWLDKYGK